MSYEAAIRALEPRTLERMTGAWLPIRLTAILLLVDMVPLWYLSPLMISLVGLGLVFPALLRTPAVWVAIMVLVTLWIVRLWPLVDNHIYLLAYWALAVVIALGRSDPQRSLAVSARWLVVFVFFWAAMWKGVLSPDYLDGRFFTVRLMSDPRFEAQAVVFSGLSLAEIRQNRAYLEFSSSDAGFEDQGSPGFQSTDRYRFWVTVFTWAVLLGEAGLALAFLLP